MEKMHLLGTHLCTGMVQGLGGFIRGRCQGSHRSGRSGCIYIEVPFEDTDVVFPTTPAGLYAEVDYFKKLAEAAGPPPSQVSPW